MIKCYPEKAAELLLTFFRNIESNLATFFYVAGYAVKNDEPLLKVWMVDIARSTNEEKSGGEARSFSGTFPLMSCRKKLQCISLELHVRRSKF
jgi:hypothetical protein